MAPFRQRPAGGGRCGRPCDRSGGTTAAERWLSLRSWRTRLPAETGSASRTWSQAEMDVRITRARRPRRRPEKSRSPRQPTDTARPGAPSKSCSGSRARSPPRAAWRGQVVDLTIELPFGSERRSDPDLESRRTNHGVGQAVRRSSLRHQQAGRRVSPCRSCLTLPIGPSALPHGSIVSRCLQAVHSDVRRSRMGSASPDHRAPAKPNRWLRVHPGWRQPPDRGLPSTFKERPRLSSTLLASPTTVAKSPQPTARNAKRGIRPLRPTTLGDTHKHYPGVVTKPFSPMTARGSPAASCPLAVGTAAGSTETEITAAKLSV